MLSGSRCGSCNSSSHSSRECPAFDRHSKVFGAPRISTDALPNKHAELKGELKFERDFCTRDVDAYKNMKRYGAQPEKVRGAAKELQRIGG